MCAYYADYLNIFVNAEIIQSTLNTTLGEASDMINEGLIIHTIIFGILPCVALCFVKLTKTTLLKAFIAKIAIILSLGACVGGSYLVIGKDIVFCV